MCGDRALVALVPKYLPTSSWIWKKIHYILKGEDRGGFMALVAILPLLQTWVGSSYTIDVLLVHGTDST